MLGRVEGPEGATFGEGLLLGRLEGPEGFEGFESIKQLGGTQIWTLKPQAQSSLCATLACPSGGLQAWLGPYFWSQCQCTNLGV